MSHAHPPFNRSEIERINTMINDGKTREEIYSYFGMRFEEMHQCWAISIDTTGCGRGAAKIDGLTVRILWPAHYKYHRAGITRKRREAIERTANNESIGIVLAKMFDRVCKEENKVNATIEDHEVKLELEKEIAKIKAEYGSDDVLTVKFDRGEEDEVDLRGKMDTDKTEG